MEYKELLVRLEDEQYETLRKLAFNTKISMAEHIRRALRKYLEKEEKT